MRTAPVSVVPKCRNQSLEKTEPSRRSTLNLPSVHVQKLRGNQTVLVRKASIDDTSRIHHLLQWNQ